MQQEMPVRGESPQIGTLETGLLARFRAWVFGYDAFISYRHADGLTYAIALENALKKRDRAVFRDVGELPAGVSLQDAIERALDKSGVLVVVATPGACAPESWVGREIDLYRPSGRPIIEIRFDVKTSVRPALELNSIVESNAAGAGPSERALARLFEEAEFRRRNRWARLLAFGALVVIAALIALGAQRWWSLAKERETRALEEHTSAIDRALQSELQAERQAESPETGDQALAAALVAYEAAKKAGISDRSELRRGLHRATVAALTLHDVPVPASKIYGDRDGWVVERDDVMTRYNAGFEPSSAAPLGRWRDRRGGHLTNAVNWFPEFSDSTQLLFARWSNEPPVAILLPANVLPSKIVRSEDHRFLVGEDGFELLVWIPEQSPLPHRYETRDIGDIAVSHNGRRIVVVSSDGSLSLWTADRFYQCCTAQIEWHIADRIETHIKNASSVAVDPRGKTACVAGGELVRCWTPGARSPTSSSPLNDEAQELRYLGDGRLAVVGRDGVSFWHVTAGAPTMTRLSPIDHLSVDRVSSDGRYAWDTSHATVLDLACGDVATSVACETPEERLSDVDDRLGIVVCDGGYLPRDGDFIGDISVYDRSTRRRVANDSLVEAYLYRSGLVAIRHVGAVNELEWHPAPIGSQLTRSFVLPGSRAGRSGVIAVSRDGGTAVVEHGNTSEIARPLWGNLLLTPAPPLTSLDSIGTALSDDGRAMVSQDDHGLTYWDISGTSPVDLVRVTYVDRGPHNTLPGIGYRYALNEDGSLLFVADNEEHTLTTYTMTTADFVRRACAVAKAHGLSSADEAPCR